MSLASFSMIVGVLGVVTSVLILAWQTMQLRRQVTVTNAAAIYTSHTAVMQLYHEIQKLLLARPDLRPYFVAGVPCPPNDPNRQDVVLIAEMIADVYDIGLQHSRTLPDPVHGECWPASAIDALKQPILSEVLQTPQPWYPELRLFWDKVS